MHTHTHARARAHTHTLQDNDAHGTEVRGERRVTRSLSPKSREHGVAYNSKPSIMEENAEDTKLYILQVSICMKARTCVHTSMQTWIFTHSISHSPLTQTHMCVCARARKHQNDVNILKKEVINVKRRVAEVAEDSGKISTAYAYRCEDCFPSLCSNMEFWR